MRKFNELHIGKHFKLAESKIVYQKTARHIHPSFGDDVNAVDVWGGGMVLVSDDIPVSVVNVCITETLEDGSKLCHSQACNLHKG